MMTAAAVAAVATATVGAVVAGSALRLERRLVLLRVLGGKACHQSSPELMTSAEGQAWVKKQKKEWTLALPQPKHGALKLRLLRMVRPQKNQDGDLQLVHLLDYSSDGLGREMLKSSLVVWYSN